VETRVQPLGGEFRGGRERETALREARMWENQPRRPNYETGCDKQVKIKRPRPPALLVGGIAARLDLEVVTEGQKRERVLGALDEDGSVEEVGLGRSVRCGPPQTRESDNVEVHPQCGQGAGKGLSDVAEVPT
jgi:hypothetical protein